MIILLRRPRSRGKQALSGEADWNYPLPAEQASIIREQEDRAAHLEYHQTARAAHGRAVS